jgi:hypothetical protein
VVVQHHKHMELKITLPPATALACGLLSYLTDIGHGWWPAQGFIRAGGKAELSLSRPDVALEFPSDGSKKLFSLKPRCYPALVFWSIIRLASTHTHHIDGRKCANRLRSTNTSQDRIHQ